MAKSIPWSEIKSKWVTTDATYSELAEEHGISLSAVSKKADKEDWQAERKKFQELSSAKTQDRISDERAEINRKHYDLWGKVIEKLESALMTALEIDEIETLTRALDRAHKGQRLAKELDRKDEQQTAAIDPALAALANGGASQPVAFVPPASRAGEDPQQPEPVQV